VHATSKLIPSLGRLFREWVVVVGKTAKEQDDDKWVRRARILSYHVF